MTRSLSLSIVIVAALTRSAAADFGDPLPGLTPPQRAAFSDGQSHFAAVEQASDGLGPIFNGTSCGGCHLGPSGAVGGSNGQLETRFGRLAGGVFDPLVDEGGSLLQALGIGAGLASNPNCASPTLFTGEVVPKDANVVARRRTTPLFGLGLVDAVDEADLVSLAAEEASAHPSTAGVVSRVTDPDTGRADAVGRFGWKAQEPTLHGFAGDAYLNEMGVTNPSFPDESCPNGDCAIVLDCNPDPGLNDDGTDVNAFASFMQLLDAPPRGKRDNHVVAGEKQFTALGCADCHAPVLQTGKRAIAALNHKRFQPYSDFLLHDMGALGDGIAQGAADGRQMRTAPLWGLHAQSTLLHDGRTSSVAEAILAHAGQGQAARDAFAALSSAAEADLLAFLASL